MSYEEMHDDLVAAQAEIESLKGQLMISEKGDGSRVIKAMTEENAELREENTMVRKDFAQAVSEFGETIRRQKELMSISAKEIDELKAEVERLQRAVDEYDKAFYRLTSLEDFAPETEPQFEVDHRIAFATAERQRIAKLAKGES